MVSSPSSALARGWHSTAQPCGSSQWSQDGGSRNQILVSVGVHNAKPRWFGGQGRVACKGAGSGKGAGLLQQLCRGGGPQSASAVRTAGSVITKEAYRLSVSSRSRWRKKEDKEGFKKKITKRKTVISNPNLALQWLC